MLQGLTRSQDRAPAGEPPIIVIINPSSLSSEKITKKNNTIQYKEERCRAIYDWFDNDIPNALAIRSGSLSSHSLSLRCRGLVVGGWHFTYKLNRFCVAVPNGHSSFFFKKKFIRRCDCSVQQGPRGLVAGPTEWPHWCLPIQLCAAPMKGVNGGGGQL